MTRTIDTEQLDEELYLTLRDLWEDPAVQVVVFERKFIEDVCQIIRRYILASIRASSV